MKETVIDLQTGIAVERELTPEEIIAAEARREAGKQEPPKPLNEQLEKAFLSFLPSHLGKPYLTAELMIQIGTLKQVVTDYNRLGLYELSKAMITGLVLPNEMEADRQALLNLFP